MSYTDLLESKHHYLAMLKDADASRRAIEKDFDASKATEYNKIMAIRNTAFINLIKEDVPYIEDDTKESLRIEIDGENYDMKKSKLKLLVGDGVYEQILARSHEHTQTMAFLKENSADIPENPVSGIPQKSVNSNINMPQAQALPMYQQPVMGVSPYGYMQQPYQVPYQGMYPYPQPYVPQQDNSQMYGMIDELTNKLNEISGRIKPETQIREVVIDDQIREQLNLSRQELEQAKKDKSEAVQKAHEAVKNLEEAKRSLDAERTRQQILSGDIESLTKRAGELQKRLEDAKTVEAEEKNALEEQIKQLNNEKQSLINKHEKETERIKQQSYDAISAEQRKLEEAKKEIKQSADERIKQLLNEKDNEIKQIESELAQKDEAYRKQIAEANEKIKKIELNANATENSVKTESDKKTSILQKQLDESLAEQKRIKSTFLEKLEIVKQKVNEANQRAAEAEANLKKQTSLTEDEREKIRLSIEEETNNRINEIKSKSNDMIAELQIQLEEKEKELDKKLNEINQVRNDSNEKANEIRKQADKDIKKIQEQLQELLSKNKHYENEISKINSRSQSKIDELNNQMKTKEEEFSRKNEEIKKQAETEKEEALRKLRLNFEAEQKQMEERYQAELTRKTSELKEAQETIKVSTETIENLNKAVHVHSQLAYYDKLTGLMNSNKFNKDFKESSHKTFAMVCINDMKSFNAQSKAVGDRVIKFIGSQLKAYSEDTYRLYGDMFGMLTNKDVEDVNNFLCNLKEELSKGNGIFIAYGVALATEGSKKELSGIAQNRMNIMRKENKEIIEKRKTKARAKEEETRKYEETKAMNEGTDSLVDIEEVFDNDGEIASKNISADETYYETMFADTNDTHKSQPQPDSKNNENPDPDDFYENLQ